MRILIAGLSHETNTFSPVPTPRERFCRDGKTLLEGKAALDFFRNTGTCIGGFLKVAEAAGAEVVCSIAAHAPPSGAVQRAAYDGFCERICADVAKGGWDAILLDLHGAMVVEGFEDGEGELMRRIRAVDARTPIAISYDMHANIYPDMVERATVTAGYHTYPHVDQGETAARAAAVLLRAMKGEVTPVTAWGRAPMLPHVMAQGTHAYPNKELQAMCRQWEESGRALTASLYVGFPHADIEGAGLSAVVTTDGDKSAAEAMVQELLDLAWKARESFVFRPEPLGESVAKAKALAAQGGDLPVVMLDHYDNCASGGTMDTTEVLAEILRQGLTDVAFFGICDKAAVEACLKAGPGAEITLDIGGKLPMPALPQSSKPLTVTGTVKTISSGTFVTKAGLSPGLKVFMGPTVVLDTGTVEIVLVTRQIEPVSPDMFRILGIEPRDKKVLAIKSRVHWRAALGPLAREIVECAGVGVCTSDFSQLKFEKVRRPIYPLDPGTNG
ncbi:M81 family metallopeptidase [Siccirubricoccus sp. KC 17139]|uniref:Microcystinase C n=1 Tax=Siccirubricoccus soli TaxID=2899147 RepID=A0ABT1DAH3_9PROT|nr:M81 family metallopeptidase [Siccirubricoccus soli]MCO6418940.1 M81 family metallopeptidase [Siccirubricoccus soli]MCP2685075.1 M81 family metallopeptidase [Siccirubricoccus soli]